MILTIQKIAVALREKGIQYEIQESEHSGADEVQLQEDLFSDKVPWLNDEGYFISGCFNGLLSNLVGTPTILKYIEQKYKGIGTELLPLEVKSFVMAEKGALLENDFACLVKSLIEELRSKRQILCCIMIYFQA